MSTSAFSIRSTAESDWREIRQLRLEMIADTPSAYTETFQDALGHNESEWRMRGQRGTNPRSIAAVAIASTGRWIGTMSGYIPGPGAAPLLVGVYVAPGFRGTSAGVTDALLAVVEEWARSESAELRLHVHEDNDRARKAYEKRGFVATGHTTPYGLEPSKNELEMRKLL